MKLLLLLICLCANSVLARQATLADYAFGVVSQDDLIQVRADGTYVVTSSLVLEIFKDEARAAFTSIPVPYSADAGNLEIVEAKVVNGTEVFPVKPESIIERSVFEQKGFNDIRVKQLAFSSLKVGSQIHIKTKRDVKKIPVEKHFSIFYPFAEMGLTKSQNIRVESELPLFGHGNKLGKGFEFKEESQGAKHVYEVRTTAAIMQDAVEEKSKRPYFSQPFVVFSTSKDDWSEIGAPLAKGFEHELTRPLPKQLEVPIAKLTAKDSDEKKFDTVLTYIAENYSYLGDWRTVEGGFRPRPLETIVQTKFGDCKDFSILLASMLRKLGMTAKVALVWRGSKRLGNSGPALPSPSAFNHAIVYVETASGKYWIDPTNPESFGFRHRLDISERPALVLDGSTTTTMISAYPSNMNKLTVKKDLQFSALDQATAHVTLHGTGEFALEYVGLQKNKSVPEIQKIAESSLIGMEKMHLPEWAPFDYTSKSFKDAVFKVNYKAEIPSKTSAEGSFIVLPPLSQNLGFLEQDFNTMIHASFNGFPFEYERVTNYKNLRLLQRPEECFIKRPWLELSRKFELNLDGFVVTDRISSKQILIFNNEIKSRDFRNMLDLLGTCVRPQGVKVGVGPGQHFREHGRPADLFSKLPASDRLRSRLELVDSEEKRGWDKQYHSQDIIEILEAAIAENPSDPNTYIELAAHIQSLEYHSGDYYNPTRIEEARAVIARGMTKLPTDKNLLLADLRALGMLKKKDEVLKRLPEVLNGYTYSNAKDALRLASLYRTIHDYSSVIDVLEKNLSLAKSTRDKEKMSFLLAYAYDRNGHREKAIEKYKTVLEINPKDSWAQRNMALTMLELGKFDEVLVLERKRLSESGQKFSFILTEALTKRGVKAIAEGKLDQAEKDLNESFMLDSSHDAHKAMVSLFAAKKEFERAFQLAVTAQKLTSNQWMHFKDMSVLLSQSPEHQLKLAEMTIPFATEPLSRLASHTLVLHSYSRLQRTDDFKKLSLTALGEAATVLKEMNRDPAHTYLTCAQLYALIGSITKNPKVIEVGKAYLAKGQSINPEHPNLLDAKAFVETMSGGRAPASVGK